MPKSDFLLVFVYFFELFLDGQDLKKIPNDNFLKSEPPLHSIAIRIKMVQNTSFHYTGSWIHWILFITFSIWKRLSGTLHWILRCFSAFCERFADFCLVEKCVNKPDAFFRIIIFYAALAELKECVFITK